MEKHPIRRGIVRLLLLPLFAAAPVCVVPRQAAAQALDVDGNGKVDVATDIVYIARRLLGLAPVPASFRAADPTIPSDTTVGSNVDALGTALDVDGNGTVDVATDIVYIARALLGLPPVPGSFRQLDPTIPDDATIAAHIPVLAGLLSFGNQVVGTTSPPQSVAFTNSTGTPVVVSNVSTSGDFLQAGACLGTLAPSQTCSISVAFSPKSIGPQRGSLTIAENVTGKSYTVTLLATGVTPASVDVSFAPLPGSNAENLVAVSSLGESPIGVGASTATFPTAPNLVQIVALMDNSRGFGWTAVSPAWFQDQSSQPIGPLSTAVQMVFSLPFVFSTSPINAARTVNILTGLPEVQALATALQGAAGGSNPLTDPSVVSAYSAAVAASLAALNAAPSAAARRSHSQPSSVRVSITEGQRRTAVERPLLETASYLVSEQTLPQQPQDLQATRINIDPSIPSIQPAWSSNVDITDQGLFWIGFVFPAKLAFPSEATFTQALLTDWQSNQSRNWASYVPAISSPYVPLRSQSGNLVTYLQPSTWANGMYVSDAEELLGNLIARHVGAPDTGTAQPSFDLPTHSNAYIVHLYGCSYDVRDRLILNNQNAPNDFALLANWDPPVAQTGWTASCAATLLTLFYDDLNELLSILPLPAGESILSCVLTNEAQDQIVSDLDQDLTNAFQGAYSGVGTAQGIEDALAVAGLRFASNFTQKLGPCIAQEGVSDVLKALVSLVSAEFGALLNAVILPTNACAMTSGYPTATAFCDQFSRFFMFRPWEGTVVQVGSDPWACGTNECSPEGATQCFDAHTQQTCIADGSGCLTWGADYQCANGCVGAACATCVNECSAGQTQCLNSTTQQTCGDYGSGCLTWGSDFQCADGCVGSACAASPAGGSILIFPNIVAGTTQGDTSLQITNVSQMPVFLTCTYFNRSATAPLPGCTDLSFTLFLTGSGDPAYSSTSWLLSTGERMGAGFIPPTADFSGDLVCVACTAPPFVQPLMQNVLMGSAAYVGPGDGFSGNAIQIQALRTSRDCVLRLNGAEYGTCPSSISDAQLACWNQDASCQGPFFFAARCNNNGTIDPGEECDGADLGGATCQSHGFMNGGTLTCNGDCTVNTIGCCNECAPVNMTQCLDESTEQTCSDNGSGCLTWGENQTCPSGCYVGFVNGCCNVGGCAESASACGLAEYAVPTAYSGPVDITTGLDGNLWFTEQSGNKIGKITTYGDFTEYAVPTAYSGLGEITTGPDGNLWFTEETGNKIGKMGISISEYPIPTANGQPGDITTGLDGNLWFTEHIGNNIGKITTDGDFTEYAIPTANSGPRAITSGPDGNLWFTEDNGNKIGTVTTSGSFTEYPIPTADSGPSDITTGPDGNLWFTERSNSKIGRITTGGTITEFSLAAGAGPSNITTGPDGNLWFTEIIANRIGRITPGSPNSVTEFGLLAANSPFGVPAALGAITSGPDGNLWFTELDGNNIGRITVCPQACGNSIREGSEQCDGSDDAACPGACQADCTCGASPTPTVPPTDTATTIPTATPTPTETPTPCFTDNGDGTITDNTTGLMWEKNDQSGGIHDYSNTYTWGMTGSPYTMNGTMVTTFLATLNAGGGFAGHTDWRIPNMNELQSLVNYQNVSPAVDTAFNTGCGASCTVLTCSCTQPGYYWSSTTYQGLPTDAWYVDFYAGAGHAGSKSYGSYVRAVRGGSSQLLRTGQTSDYGAGSDGNLQEGAARSYTDNGDGTITDNTTGLMWEKNDQSGGIHDYSNTYTWGMTGSPYTMNGTMVTTFLATLNAGGGFAGHTDWRIPNMNELQSLVNYQNVSPAVDRAFNTGCGASCTVLTCSCTVSYLYWSSSTVAAHPNLAWLVDFSNGYVYNSFKFSLYHVRAVRGGL